MGSYLHTPDFVPCWWPRELAAPHPCSQAPMGLSAGTAGSLGWLELIAGIPFSHLGGCVWPVLPWSQCSWISWSVVLWCSLVSWASSSLTRHCKVNTRFSIITFPQTPWKEELHCLYWWMCVFLKSCYVGTGVVHGSHQNLSDRQDLWTQTGEGLPGALLFSALCFYSLQVKVSITSPLQKLPSALTMDLSPSFVVFSDFQHLPDPAGSCPAGNQHPPRCAPPCLTQSALALQHSPSEQRRDCSFCPVCLKFPSQPSWQLSHFLL